MKPYDVQATPAQLPPFLRLAWSCQLCFDVWSPRLQQILSIVPAVNMEAINQGLKTGILTFPSSRPDDETLRANRRIGVHVLDEPQISRLPRRVSRDVDRPVLPTFRLLCHETRTREIGEILRQGSGIELLNILGYPSCCCEKFEDAALGSEEVFDPVVRNIEEVQASSSSVHIDTSPVILNLFWRRIGIAAIDHIPCGPQCFGSIDLGMQYLGFFKTLGHKAEADWLEEVLSWPVERSVLHGITETKTPIMKFISNGVTVRKKLVSRRESMNIPPEAPYGTSFPYRQNEKALIAARSPSTERALTQIITT